MSATTSSVQASPDETKVDEPTSIFIIKRHIGRLLCESSGMSLCDAGVWGDATDKILKDDKTIGEVNTTLDVFLADMSMEPKLTVKTEIKRLLVLYFMLK